MKTHILDEHTNEVVGEITCGAVELDVSSSSDRTCILRRLKNLSEVVVATCELDIKPEQTFVWTQLVSCHAALCLLLL